MLGRSPDTIIYYEEDFSHFMNFVGKNAFCHEITKNEVNKYFNHLRQKEANGDLATTTISTYLRAVRAPLYYFMEQSYMAYFKITVPKPPRVVKPTYKDHELDMILEKPNIKTSFPQYRTWAASCFVYATGARMNTLSKCQDWTS